MIYHDQQYIVHTFYPTFCKKNRIPQLDLPRLDHFFSDSARGAHHSNLNEGRRTALGGGGHVKWGRSPSKWMWSCFQFEMDGGCQFDRNGWSLWSFRNASNSQRHVPFVVHSSGIHPQLGGISGPQIFQQRSDGLTQASHGGVFFCGAELGIHGKLPRSMIPKSSWSIFWWFPIKSSKA